jgi:phage-related protein
LTGYGGSAIRAGVANEEKPLVWVASCKKDLRAFPPDVQDVMGYALDLAQRGQKHPDSKPMKGFGSGVLEVVDDYDGETYRAVYTVKYEGIVYAVHAFQKKSKKGDETPKPELDKIDARLKAIEAQRQKERKKDGKDRVRAK